MSNYIKPYLWYSHAHYPNRLYAKYDWRVRKTDRFIFMRANKISEKGPYDLILEIPKKGTIAELTTWDVIESSFGSPIVNSRTLDILKSFCPDDFQAFPMVIEAKDGILEKEYWALNILNKVDCIDKHNSLLDFDSDGDIDHIDRLVFKTDSMAGV